MILTILLWAILTIVVSGLLYHYFLLAAGGRPRRNTLAATVSQARLLFAITVPAHNEESVIGASVARLRQTIYPSGRFDVHVVADYCDDGTAQAARVAGAVVHERHEGPRGRKGYALHWLLARLLDDGRRYDAIVVLDADSRIAPDFLDQMNQALVNGAQVAQGRHVIANPDASVFTTLADADMRLNNRIRNQAKENLGLSARLMGDAMCFRREVLEAYPWVGARSLTEDREYGIHLVIQCVRVRFVPDAISVGQAAARWSDATGQRLRWYGDVFDLQKRYLGPLLASAWHGRSLDALDRALELILPPFSTLAMLSVVVVVAQLGLGIQRVLPTFVASVVAVLLVLAYPFVGLVAERAPWRSFRALMYGPVYTAWRVGLSLIVRLKRGKIAWIRTPRAEEVRVTK